MGIILTDLSKAFDCILHGLLLTKLKCYGLSRQACLLLSYITDRKQRVKMGPSCSEWRSVAQGVPQGCIVEPLIFNTFINNVFYVLKSIYNSYNYADDNTLLNNHPDTSDISLCVSDMNIPLKPCLKWLGVLLDYERNFLDHVTDVCKRASRQLNAVPRVAKYLNKDCLVKLFHAFIISNFSYCVTSQVLSKGKIYRKAALRMVFNDHDADYNQLLSMSDDEASDLQYFYR